MSSSHSKQTSGTTPLHSIHIAAGARMVDFSGWDMPLHYGSQLEEHKRVRTGVGIFDVSHMAAVDIQGPDALPFLRILLANDADRLEPGAAQYTLMLNDEGGVIDDLLCYRRPEAGYRLVINCGNRQSDLDWMKSRLEAFDAVLERRDDLGILALQGPESMQALQRARPAWLVSAEGLARFHALELDGVMIARTGYTGEDGFEIMLPAEELAVLWRELVEAGATPCGLGARDSLRLEAGMCLYGHEMDAQTSPLEAGLGWTVAWQPEDREFVGRRALEKQRGAGVRHKLAGLVLEDRGVLREGQEIWVAGEPQGVITSGSFSPVIGKSIALARVPVSVSGEVQVEMRGKRLRARVTQPPFVRNGKIQVRD